VLCTVNKRGRNFASSMSFSLLLFGLHCTVTKHFQSNECCSRNSDCRFLFTCI